MVSGAGKGWAAAERAARIAADRDADWALSVVVALLFALAYLEMRRFRAQWL